MNAIVLRVTAAELTKEDLLLISYMRNISWGEFKVKVKNGKPVTIEAAIKTINLERNN